MATTTDTRSTGPLATADGVRGSNRTRTNLVWVLALSVLAVLMLTLTPVGSRTRAGVNLVPFATILQQLRAPGATAGLANLAGNLALFAPTALLATLATRRPARVVLACFLGSMAIELLQPSIGRSGDVDDLILNTVGAALAAGLGAFALAGTALVGTARLRRSTSRRHRTGRT